MPLIRNARRPGDFAVTIDRCAGILMRIERFLAEHDMSAGAFGTRYGDNSIVYGLRHGRVPSAETIARLDAFMAEHVA